MHIRKHCSRVWWRDTARSTVVSMFSSLEVQLRGADAGIHKIKQMPGR